MRHRRRPSSSVRAALLALSLSACAVEEVGVLEEAGGPEELTDDGDAVQIASDGTPHSASIAADGWVTHSFVLEETSDVVVVLDWARSSVNLNLFLYNPSGTLATYAGGTSTRPEEVHADDAAPGTWKIGIKNKSTRRTSYTLSVSATPVGGGGGGGGGGEVPLYAARPAAGTVFWGAAVSGNGDPEPRHEIPSGHPLSVRRTFWRWDQRLSGMITTARSDHEHGRLPWVSTKTPSWADMGAGLHDAEIDSMLNALEGLGHPVWLTLHHEPEGGGGVNAPDDPAGPAGHIAMNRRVRQRMTALGTQNIALAPILMSWTWTDASGRNVDEWWADGIYDFLGVDHYRDGELSLLNSTWAEVRQWAAARSVDVAVGEWGMRGTDDAAGQRVRAWYEAAIASASDGGGARVVGLCAFDSGLNSPSGSWELVGAQLEVFQALLGDPRTASVDDY